MRRGDEVGRGCPVTLSRCGGAGCLEPPMTTTLDAIMIDQREPEWVQQLAFGGVPTCVTLLDHGDVLATATDGELIAIERKTGDDFLNSLADDRLLGQLVGMRKVTPWSYLVVTGTFRRAADGKLLSDRGATGWGWAAVQGALLSCQELGVFVTFAANDAEFEATVLRIVRRNRSPEMVIAPPRVARLLSPGEAMLAALPGIGIEKVNRLLEYAGYPGAALAYLTDRQLQRGEHVPGIGSLTKQNVRRALELPEWAELAIIDTETQLLRKQPEMEMGNYVTRTLID